MLNQELKIITTEDGSHSIFNSTLNEHYHSVHGSINESQHVFIEAGLQKAIAQTNSQLNLLEVGLGTGLNALLTAIYMQKNKIQTRVIYTALEPYPLNTKITSELNYTQILNQENSTQIFNNIHNSNFNESVLLQKKMLLKKINTSLEQISFNETFDLIYFDAFAPRVQPELWEKSIFEKLFHQLNNEGILVTYCAKGEVKRNMKAAGFCVEALPGPPGKREMTRATKK